MAAIQDPAQRRYSVVLIPNTADGGYVVEVPALPGLVTYGETIETALEMARDAIESWIDVQIETGRPIPVEDEPIQVVTLAI